MHNIKDLRNNLAIYKKKLLDRKIEFDEVLFEKLDKNNRKLISEKEKLKKEKKILSKSKDKANFQKSKKISDEILNISKEQTKVQKELNKILYFLPNLALDDVPIGEDEKSNKLIKKFGNIKISI